MAYNREEFAYEATALRGAAALKEMLDNIGREDGKDADVAKVLTDHEMQLRALLTFALDALNA